MPQLAIIGDGYSAAVLTYHLLKRNFDPADLMVFGPGELGLGQAYGNTHDHYRLNVRDDLMRIDPDQPDDFIAWAKHHINDPDAFVDAGAFYRRSDFARYLQEKLASMIGSPPITHIKETVQQISRDGGWLITTASGQFHAELLVIATGNPPSTVNFTCQDGAEKHMTTQPWRGDWTDSIQDDDDIAVIGGGLTAMDILTSLAAHQHSGHIHVISPKGILPPPQLNWRLQPDDDFKWPPCQTASEMVQVMNDFIGKTDWHHCQTQEKFEMLRKNISPAWRHLPDQEQARLKRHLGWLWQVLRYRAAPQGVMAQQRLTDQGQLSLIKGRVKAVDIKNPSQQDHDLSIHLSDGQIITVDHAFVATGTGQDPLLAQMARNQDIQLKNGHAVVDDLLHLMTTNGIPYADGYALGPPTAMARGDVIGATTIAGEAVMIAENITASLNISSSHNSRLSDISHHDRS